MRAKELADLAGTTVRTIRYYHQLGLLAVPEPGTSWRSYGFAHLTRLMRIRWLVESGVPLVEVPHMLRPPGNADERSLVVEDLDAVLASMDAKIAVLTAQRARVETLLERVASQGRLSPLPPSLVRLYAALLERPLPPAMVEVMLKERDLLELACYRRTMPQDIVTLVDALSREDLDEMCSLWQECARINEAARERVTLQMREQIMDVVRRLVDLATRVEPEATHRLLGRAAELDRPAVRAAYELAYPSPVYRQLVSGLVTVAQQRSAA
ncbi:MAG: MerR family transcriptional regulator [Dermatophilaceae bacterium]